MFGKYDLDSMNETDVREVIVRELLHQLGYRQGTAATIKTEVSLRYGKAFLGRRNPVKDPDLKDLRGRADYICEVVSYGRWVVEVKAPGEELTLDDAQQAHTYAAHPEVAAIYYVLTNGREFHVYRTSYPKRPLYTWRIDQTASLLLMLKGLLGPQGIKRRAHIPVDLGDPIREGLDSSVRIVGGMLTYDSYEADHPALQQGLESIQGSRISIVGKRIFRNDEGQIVAEIETSGPFGMWDAINKAAGLESYVFKTSAAYISGDEMSPTLSRIFLMSLSPPARRSRKVQFFQRPS